MYLSFSTTVLILDQTAGFMGFYRLSQSPESSKYILID